MHRKMKNEAITRVLEQACARNVQIRSATLKHGQINLLAKSKPNLGGLEKTGQASPKLVPTLVLR
jgi:hypothetical protein